MALEQCFVAGTIGSGKGLYVVDKIKRALEQGRKVATNMDIFPDKLLHKKSRATLLRLPDFPRVEDLENMGFGCDEEDKKDVSKYGLLALDEVTLFLNSRTWSDPNRLALLKFLILLRKRRWQSLFTSQDPDSLDKQVKKSLINRWVTCTDVTGIPLPIVGRLGVKMPSLKVATKYSMANGQIALKLSRSWYRGKDLYDGYDSWQEFTAEEHLIGDQLLDMRSSYSLLSAWHLKGRYIESKARVQLLNKIPLNERTKRELPRILRHLPPDRRTPLMVETIINHLKTRPESNLRPTGAAGEAVT